jgi:endonuclease/exonuclease/phosphatase family metal-dependent hydrolase
LVGRTKFAAKGVFAFDLESQGEEFARVFSTHLQHSEISQFPTEEEVEARRKQMQIIIDKVNAVRNRCIVVTGDLNLDDDEYLGSSWHPRFQKGDRFADGEWTWGGSAFCSKLVHQRPSGPLNLDHTMVLAGTAREILTTLVQTGFDGRQFREKALSDHAGLFSRIVA